MGNSLLDFVMAVARDPQAAARYAADPAGALAAAELTGVTPADVDNLLPMVADSIATTTPGLTAGNGSDVWTTSAAAAALDSFAPHGPGVLAPPPVDTHPVVLTGLYPEPGGSSPASDVTPGPVPDPLHHLTTEPTPEAAPDGTQLPSEPATWPHAWEPVVEHDPQTHAGHDHPPAFGHF